MDLLNSPSLKSPFRSSSDEKRKYQRISTDLTLSCSYLNKKCKRSPGKNVFVGAVTLFYDHTDVVASATRNLLDGSCMYSEVKKETGEKESDVSTELSLSLGEKSISKDHKKQEKRARVSDELSLSLSLSLYDESRVFYVEPIRAVVPFDQDVWKIKKTLKISDLEGLSRLLVPKALVDAHIFPSLRKEQIEKIMAGEGIEVAIFDCDEPSSHDLVFKRWCSSDSFIFLGGWKREFVNRRHLKIGDTIGLYWDQFHSRFNFAVLGRSP
ncbi:AP2/B3-like transcriptional factor family protein [Euphorbia peplus]|nr:AP2/B3-like transcriptional factor family protein [Euphorbia peplus]